MRYALLFAVVLALSPLSAMAGDAVRIIDPWARASILASRPGVAYLTMESTRDDRLLTVESPVAARVMIHAVTNRDGVNRMVHLDALDLPAGEPVVLAPGGTHLMLMGLKARLSEGARFPVTLGFERAGVVTVTVPVLGIGARRATGDRQ